MKRYFALIRLDPGNPKFLVAQYKALASQIPVLYILLITNALAVAITHVGTAPMWLALYVPVALSVVCLFRLCWWELHGRDDVTPEKAYRVMKRTTLLAAILTVGFAFWAVALYSYGNAYQQGQIAYFLVVTGISCIFCLMHLPVAALITTFITFATMVVTFSFSGNSVFLATAISVVCLTYPFMRVILSYFQNFSGLVKLAEELEEKQAETERLSIINHRNALEDQLTGLANRRRFFDTLETVLRDRPESRPVVGLIDLDGFKPVNDVFGHAAGDQVLKETATRLVEMVGSAGVVARLGGDEFGIIFPADMTLDEVVAMGQTLCTRVREPFYIPGGIVRVSGSCGVVYPDQGAHVAEELYEKADFALYQVKSKRNGGVEVFSAEHEKILTRRHMIELELQSTDFADEMFLEYQPIMDLGSGQVAGYEALARWESAKLGRVGPDAFIPAAERTGVIGKISRMLFAQALEALVAIPSHLRLSFNLSARDICDNETCLALLAMIHRSGIDPSRIEFEITETALLSDFETARQVINLLRAAGISIALDDFGTGYSSISHIHKLEFDKLKIDKTFVMRFVEDPRCMNITRTFASLCSNLGIAGVAEGVETAEVADALRQLGVKYGQGYYFSRSLSLKDAIAYAERQDTQSRDILRSA